MSEWKLGQLVRDLEFSGKEKNRIAELLKAESPNKKIFLAYGGKSPLFKSLAKDIKIRGHSPGRPAHSEKALLKMLDEITTKKKGSRKACWLVYENAIADYVNLKQKKLDTLLMEARVKDKNLSCEDLLKNICKNAKRFKVTSKVIKEFYGLWGFERVNDLGGIMSLCGKNDPDQIEKVKLKEIENALDVPEEILSEQTPDWDTSTKELLKLSKKIKKEKPNKATLEELQDIAKILTVLADKNNEENKLIDAIKDSLIEFKKDLSGYEKDINLSWLNNNIIDQIIIKWDQKLIDTEECDLQALENSLQNFRENILGKLKLYCQYGDNKNRINVEIAEIDSSLPGDLEARKKERYRQKELKAKLETVVEALEKIEDYFAESIFSPSCCPDDDAGSKIDSIDQKEAEKKDAGRPKNHHTTTSNKEQANKKKVLKSHATPPVKEQAPQDKKLKQREGRGHTEKLKNSSLIIKTSHPKQDKKKVEPAPIGTSPEILAQQFLDKSISDSYKNRDSQSNLFWLLIERGYLNYAYWFVKSLEDSGILSQGLPPSSLIKVLSLADKINNEYDVTTADYYETIQNIETEGLTSLINTTPESGLGIRCLIIASMVQPAFFVPTFPALFVQVANCGFSGGLYEFFNTIHDFFKRPIGLSSVSFSEAGKAFCDPVNLPEIQAKIKDIKNAPWESGWDFWKPPAKMLLNRDPFKSLVTSIEKNEIGKAPDIAKIINKYNSEKAIAELLRDTQGEISRRHKGSHHNIKEIVGHPRQEFSSLFKDLFENAGKWVSICFYNQRQQQDPQKARLNKFVSFLRTQIPKIRKKLKDLPKDNYISSHAGVSLLENYLETIEFLINEKPLPFQKDVKKWFNFPLSLENNQGTCEVPFLALRIAKIVQSNFDIRDELDESLKVGEFARARELFDELRQSSSSEWAEEYHSKLESGSHEFKNNVKNQMAEIEVELRDAYMQAIIDDFDSSHLSSSLEFIEEMINTIEHLDYPKIEADLKDINYEIRNKKSQRLQEFKERYETIKKNCFSENSNLPKKWIEDLDTAFNRSDVSVVEEFINHYEESLENSDTFLYERSNKELSRLQEFIKKEKEICEFFSGIKPGKELINSIKRSINDNKPFGPLMFSMREKGVNTALTGWNGLNGRHRNSNISQSEKTHLLAILESLGFLGANIISGEVLNQNLLLKTKVKVSQGEAPFPHFGSFSDGNYNIVLAWKKSFSEIFQTLDSFNIKYETEPLILIIFDDLNEQERREFLRFCHENSLSILLIDRLVFLFLLSQGVSTTESRMSITFKVTLPFTYNNPYAEAGRPPPTEMIFGRKDEIKSALSPTGAAMIFGGRQLGKSTILKEAREKFNNPESNRFGIPGDDLNDDFRNFKGEALNEKVSEFFWNNIGRAFAAAGILDHMEAYTKNDIRNLLLVNKKNINILITFDEVDTFLDLDFQNDFRVCSDLRTLAQDTNFRFKVVMAGLANVQRYARIPNFPLTQLGAPLAVGMMPHSDAMALIREPLENAGYSIEDRAVYQILAYTNRHPGLIQVFCHYLVKRLSKRVAINEIDSPGYKIGEGDIRNVYKDSRVRKYITERFRWTLNLDPSWATIAYGLCIKKMEKTEFDVTEAKAIGEEFWPQGFKTKSLTILDTILKEMVNLGVLITKGNMYRLRSHNVKQLLGSQNEMHEELVKVVEDFKDNIPEYRHRTYRVSGHKHFSPLTLADEIALIGHEQQEVTSKNNKKDGCEYSVASLFGSDTLGLFALSEALGTLGEFEGISKNYTIVSLKAFETIKEYIDAIENKLKTYRGRPIILIIEMAKYPPFPEIYIQILNYLTDLRRKTHRANTRVICKFGPEASWKWLGLKNHPNHEKEIVTLTLARWGRSTIKKFLSISGFHARDANIDFVIEKTGGWFSLLSKFLELHKGKVDEPRSVKGVDRTFPNHPSNKYCKSHLEKQGLLELPFALPTLKQLIKQGLDNEVSPACLELVGEEVVKDHPIIEPHLFSNPDRMLQWFLRMGVIEPSEGEEKNGDYRIEKLTRAFLND
jgi:hypothetical protein